MLIVPYQIDMSSYALYVIIGQENIERIKQYDPAVVKMSDLPQKWRQLKLAEVVITYITAEETQKFVGLCSELKVVDALKLVTRGFRFRPDLGDYDGPPLLVTPEPGEKKQ